MGKKENPLPAILVWSTVVFVAAVFLWILGDILWHGAGQINWKFLLSVPRNAGRDGGIGPILVSTLYIMLVCMAFALPLGLGAAVFLAEFTSAEGLFGLVVRRSLDVLAGVPSIVFGLFGNVFFCKTLGLGFSILSGGLTLACMVLPILIRSTEEGFRSIPQDYRMGAAALGLTSSTALLKLFLPIALPGLMVGLVLGLGRAMAETAALIFTSGYVDRLPSSVMDSGRALSIHIYDLSMNVSGGDANAYGSSLVLVAILLAINSTAAWLSERWLHKHIIPL